MTDTSLNHHHIARIDQAHNRLDVMDRRVGHLERSEAVSAERTQNIQASLSKIEANISRVAWLIITAIIGGVLAFIMNGGLNIGQ